MARVTYGSGITDYEGSIGGITSQHNTSGPIAKLRPNPIVNPTALQASYQQRLSYLVSFWPTLTQVQKDSWNTFAAAHDHTTPWGDVKTLSGYQWFLSCNLRRMIYHSTPLSSAPVWAIQAPPVSFTLQLTLAYIRPAWSPAYDAPGDLIAYVSLPLRQASLKLRRSLFFLKYYRNAPALNSWDLTTETAALYNVTWFDFYDDSNCSIILRILQGDFDTGLFSSFTSAIAKVVP